jgi:hypothetical protein
MAVAELPASAKQRNTTLASKPRSLFSDSMARLKHNRLAMLGIVFLILMALASIFAPVITTGDFAAQDL